MKRHLEPTRAPGASRYMRKSLPGSSHAEIIALLGKGDGRLVVDVGCASGFLAEELAINGWRVVGIEPDRAAADQARRYCDKVLCSSLEDIDFSEFSSASAVVLGDVLEHLAQPGSALERIVHSLSPDSAVVISVPNVANIWIRIQLLLGRFDYTERGILDRTHLRFFTRKSFLQMIDDSDLTVVGLRVTAIPLEEVSRMFRRQPLRALNALLLWVTQAFKNLLGYQFVVLAYRRSQLK